MLLAGLAVAASSAQVQLCSTRPPTTAGYAHTRHHVARIDAGGLRHPILQNVGGISPTELRRQQITQGASASVPFIPAHREPTAPQQHS